MKKAILLAAFGTTDPQGERDFQRIEAIVRTAFSASFVGRAYTSRFIRERLAKLGRAVDSPARALDRMVADGCSSILVWPLFVAAGAEYEELRRLVTAFRRPVGKKVAVALASPLLQSSADTDRIADALLRLVPAQRRRQDAVIIVGHGSKRDPIDSGYGEVMERLRREDRRFYFATLEGATSIENLLPTLQKDQIRKVFLLPFLLLAGRHVTADLAGAKPDSWKSILASHGISSQVLFCCIAAADEIIELWLERLKTLTDGP